MARILVIDDDRLVRSTIGTMLGVGSHKVILAEGGEDGLRCFRAQAFDLVLCDIAMPQMDGLQTIRELRKLSPDIPIISMTGSYPRPTGGAHLDPNFLAMSKQVGATRVIGKPFRLDDLLAVVRQCLAPAARPSLEANALEPVDRRR